jgi:hypothetical protein
MPGVRKRRFGIPPAVGATVFFSDIDAKKLTDAQMHAAGDLATMRSREVPPPSARYSRT